MNDLNAILAHLHDIKIVDPRNVGSGATISFIDEATLGAYKVEYYVVDGVFLGAKQYTMYTFPYQTEPTEAVLKKAIVKVKGISGAARSMENVKEL